MAGLVDHTDKLVLTPAELEALPQNTTIPIDVSWFMPNVPRKPDEEFQAKRIPRARRMNLDVVASKHELGLPHMMPDSQTFADACGSIGVDPNTHVVLYDTTGVFSSPRALFMFKAFGHKKASILNGGFPRWEQEGRAIETGEPTPVAKAVYPTPTLNTQLIRNYEQIVANTKGAPNESEIVLDARPHGRFTGQDPEPRPGLSSGHMPNSRSLPFSTLVQANQSSFTTLKETPDLKVEVEKVLGPQYDSAVHGNASIVNSCGSGMTAAVIWLALQQLGVNSAIYDESWMGYAARPESKIVKGE